MATVHDLTAWLIMEQRSSGRQIDKMQLQKLLYLVQGAHLALWGRPAFQEPILAYKNGPVVRAVESTYRPTVEGRQPLEGPLGGDASRLQDEVVETARVVLKYFGTWTAPNLEHYTKRRDSPWQEARGDLPSDALSDMEIDVAAIAAWFRRNGVNPAQRPLTVEERKVLDRVAAGDEEALTSLLQ